MLIKIVSFLLVTFAPVAMACPGGHVKSLTYGPAEIGQIDMIGNRVKVVHPDAELLSIVYSPVNEIALIVCGLGAPETCDYDQGLPAAVTGGKPLSSQPDSHLLIDIRVGGKTIRFDATDFYVARGSCGGLVAGTESN
jgi:hypothetical protein